MFLSLISFYHDRKLISWRNFSRIIEKWTRNILVSNGWRQTRCEGKGRGSEGSGTGRSEIWFPILLSCGKSLWEKYRYHLIWVGRVQMSTSLVSADIHFVVNLGIWCFITFLFLPWLLRSYMSVTSDILTLTAYLGFRFSFSVLYAM